nr:hypothetical protein [bacterium]
PTATATPEIVPPTPPPSPSPTAARTPTPVPTPSAVPTASATPTPAYCAAALEVASAEDLWIAHPRAAAASGWSWALVRAEDPAAAGYGTVADNANSFSVQSAFVSQPAALLVRPGTENPAVLEGDYLRVTHDGGQVLNVYPPAFSAGVDVYYYIGSDGSTYNDRWLCDLAKAAVTPTPSPTVTPDTGTPTAAPASPTATPTPSATPTAPAPSPTPTIIGCLAASGEVRLDTGSPLPGGAWVRLVFADGAGSPVEVAPDGSYLATGCTHLPDGTVRVEARAPGCFPWYSQTDYRDWSGIDGVTVELSVLPGRVGVDSADFDWSGYPSRALWWDEDDIAVFRPTTGQWLVRGVTRIYFGREYDTLVSADYNGDGVAEAAVFRGENGLWVIRGLTRLYYGGFMDIPVPADYDGDGTAEPGIYRHTTGLWAYRGVGRAFHGGVGDFPVVWRDGRGAGSVPAVYRPASALWYVRGLTRVYFGRTDDVPVPGAYAGTEEYVPSVFRPELGRWLIRGLTGFYFGQEGDSVFPMKDTVGDRPAVFRDENARWFIRGVTAVNYGRQGDRPVAR